MFPMQPQYQPGRSGTRRRPGFSLIELLVVLAILAALTTIALRSVSNVQSQARYQQTTHALDEIRNAILGPAHQRNPDGTPLVTGFLADTGYLPVYVAAGDPLGELTTNPNNIPAYGLVYAASDSAIRIGAGWQGPYVRLGPGATTLLDGWGNPFHLYDGTSNLITAPTTPIAAITSWCADNNADPVYGGTGNTNGYNADVAVPIPATGLGSYQAQLTGTLQILDTSGNPIVPLPTTYATSPVTIYVVYFGPNGHAVAETPAAVNLTTGQFTVSGTIGPRVLKAYVLAGSGTSFNAGTVAAAHAFSVPLDIIATGGGQIVPNLVIRNYTP